LTAASGRVAGRIKEIRYEAYGKEIRKGPRGAEGRRRLRAGRIRSLSTENVGQKGTLRWTERDSVPVRSGCVSTKETAFKMCADVARKRDTRRGTPCTRRGECGPCPTGAASGKKISAQQKLVERSFGKEGDVAPTKNRRLGSDRRGKSAKATGTKRAGGDHSNISAEGGLYFYHFGKRMLEIRRKGNVFGPPAKEKGLRYSRFSIWKKGSLCEVVDWR